MSEAVAYKLREGLVVVEQVQRGKPYFVVKNPGTGRVYGLSRASYDLMQELGGGVPVAELSARAVERGDRSAPGKIDEFVLRMREAGILEGGEPLETPPTDRAARILEKLRRFNPLYIKIGTINPTPVLKRIERIYYPLFSWPAFIVMALGAVFSAVLIAEHAPRFWHTFLIFRQFEWWAVAYVLLTLCTIVHELGHAMACRKFGGQVPEMGFLFYVLQLGMYTNVTDAWLFPRRRHRIVVSLAGVYVESFGFIAAIIVWAFSRPFATTNQIAFVVAVVIVSRIMLNLFPFLRLDGYFVLTDVLALRNLRPKSFALILSYLPRIGRSWRPATPMPLREKIILTIYGSISLAVLAWVLPMALHGIHLRLVHSSPEWGNRSFVALLCGLVPMIVLSVKRSMDKLKTTGRRIEARP